MKVAVEVADASDLMPKDGHGSANPFVEVDFQGQRQRTRTSSATSPLLERDLVFNLSDPSSSPPSHRRHRLPRPPRAAAPEGRRGPPPQLPRPRPHLRRVGGALPAEAVVQRFPLDKRGLFSNIRGDIALRVYALPDSPAESAAAAAAAAAADPQPDPVAAAAAAAAAAANGVGLDAEAEAEKKKTKKKKGKPSSRAQEGEAEGKEPPAPAPRVFFSVGAAPPPAAAGAQKPPTNVFYDEKPARAVPPPPGATVVQARPPGGAGAPGAPRPEFGLVETRPPLAARLARSGRLGARDKISSTYDLVEPMHYLYVSVVKARNLPAKDITGSLDPYVEVKLGNYKGITKHLEKNQNPVWHQVFAFSKDRIQANMVEVTVKDKDLVKDDFVGRIVFDLTDVPLRVPPDSPLAPQWYRLEDKKGDKLTTGGGPELMLAVWIGTQADEAFPEAWHSDAHSVSLDALANTRSKVYFSPKLVYLRVLAIEAQDLVPADKSRPIAPSLKIQLGHQLRRTRPGSPPGSVNPVWNEEFLFVAAEPFDEPLVITVEDRVAPGRDEPLGRLTLPVSVAVPRNEHNKPVEPKWFSLSRPTALLDEEKKESTSKFSSKVHLRLSLDLGYHVLDESTHYSSDLQPSSKNLRKPRIGILELGILSARNLVPMKAKDGRTTDAYCVAKYGNKWVRTRTLLDTLAPQWNEQYTWEVFDPCTVITIAVFDNCHVAGHNGGGDVRDQRIGKVRIRLSTLEADRIYTHLYPLLVLQTSGLKKTGELHLAVRFTCTAWVNMVTLYGKPLLPKMHYVQPISVLQLDYLRHQAMQIVAARLVRAEPPLRREVVEYMLDVDSHMFSLRRSKANFYRITSLFSGMAAIGRWYNSIRNWRNPITTVLVHVLFLILVGYPELILPTIFLYLFMIGIWSYRFRPRHPPHMDTRLSYAEMAHPDELDEEFDTFPTSKAADVVRMRYDRLRSVAGRVQTVAGDLATQGERAQALLSWRDPRATAIFIIISLIIAIVLYVTPFQVIAVIVGLYLLRHPRFRSKMPSVPYNFYRRLPSKSDMLL
ncbi:Protein QUIRKY [Ananas comosus]|uniref:Protein QUIRKY n=1 Tax=Ananas comosus TaxID=4615 RepID=A0A199UT35_ANACO|nr:Protein QUIRKY [Ananas comosus]